MKPLFSSHQPVSCKNKSLYDVFLVYIVHISPHCEIVTGNLGLLFGPVGTFSIFRRTNNPSITRPEREEKMVKRRIHLNLECIFYNFGHNLSIRDSRT